MTVEDTDQVQDTETTESKDTEVDTESKTEETEETKDNQKDQDKEQSKTEETTEKLYSTPDGRKLTSDQMFEEYGKLLPEFTRRSQKLKEFEKLEEQRKSEAKMQADAASSELLKKVPPDVKEAITQIVTPLFEQKLKDIEEQNRKAEEAKEQERRDNEFKSTLTNLEGKYNGKNPEYKGIPRFDRAEVMRAMRDPDNKIFDPELKFMDMHRGKFLDLEIKKALKQQGGGNQTERTGASDENKGGTGAGKSPKTIREASSAFLERLRSMGE